MKNKFYITTAIDYVNARPHVGHAFEKVLADALARWNKLLGKEVFFLTGVDENAQKNVQAAEKARIKVEEFVEKNTNFFKELVQKLNINCDKFIRTSEGEHAKVVKKILQKIIDKKEVYKGSYEGYYCVGCEGFVTEKDLINGNCPEHGKKPEYRKEDAYFFKLSKYRDKLIKFVKNYIVPEDKENEILSRLEEGLNDLCISRKANDWGIDFPGDKNFKVYVWVDALINYISGAEKQWPADLHVIGKGINWFHSVIWPALLMSAGYKLPKKLLVHGYLISDGQKMSKSLGNVIDPLELLEKYHCDSVRYSLLRCNVFSDSDYSEQALIDRHNNELANKLGNLISRVSTLAEKYGLEKSENKLLKKLKLKEIKKHFENYETDKALNLIFEFIDVCNEYVQEKKPWETKDKKVLYSLIDSIKAVIILLSPFIPETCEKISSNFGFKISLEEIKKPFKISKIKKSEVLFKKIEEKVNKPEVIEGIVKMTEINYSDFEKVEMKVGKILKIEDIEGADKLYKLEVDIGEKRTVVAGLKPYYKKDELKGKRCIVLVNLEPRVLRGVESKGMILAACSEDKKKVVILQPEKDIEVGSRVS